MHKKFSIDYVLAPQHNHLVRTHHTDDPVEAESFLSYLLTTQARINAIRHDGEDLVPHQFDRMIRIAAEALVVRMLSHSLDLDGAAVRHRFGFAS